MYYVYLILVFLEGPYCRRYYVNDVGHGIPMLVAVLF